MKPKSRTTPALHPQEIARWVRERVASRMTATGYTPASGEQFLDRIEKLAANLALWGSKMNLTARPEDPAEIAFHVIDSLMPAVIANGPEQGILAGKFDKESTVLDLGSGAGFPGLVLAAATEATFTMVESRRKRASFLTVAVADLGLRNVRIETRHISTASPLIKFDMVTARAFGDPASFYPIAAAALRSNAVAMLYASPSQRLSLEAARSAGLDGYTRMGYAVERDDRMVARVLALWSKA